MPVSPHRLEECSAMDGVRPIDGPGSLARPVEPCATARRGWRARWSALRDRLLMDPRFQDWASRSPLTRLFARNRARALFDLCAGFVYSQILASCVRLGLFESLRAGPLPLPTLAARLGLTAPAAERLLRAAAALDLVEDRGGVWGLGDLGAAMLGNPGVAAMVEHHALLYADLADPVALLRHEVAETALGRFWPYAGKAPTTAPTAEEARAYSAVMAASQAFVAREVLSVCRLERVGRLLDVGGGDGTFAMALAARLPRVQLTLFDLPPVAAVARARFASAGLGTRAEAVGGSFLVDPLPTGAEVVTLVRVLFDHPDATVLGLLRAVRAALPAHGRLVIAEPMAGLRGAEAMGDAYFGFYLLAMGEGRPRTPAEHCALLATAGFSRTRVRSTRMPLLAGVVEARP